MKFTCLKENLFPAIEAISRVGGRATTLPILQQTLIEATEGRISFTTTDLEIAIETWVSGKVDQPGKGTAPTALFTQLITQALPGKISVERKSAALAVKTENFSSTLAGFDPAEFPIIPKLASARRAGTIPGETLARAITQVLPAAATSDVRPELSGLYLEFGGRALTLAATDSFRLAERTLTPVARREGEKPEKVIVPARAMSEVSRIFGVGNEEIEVLVEKAQIVFQAKNTRLTSRSGASRPYPNRQSLCRTGEGRGACRGSGKGNPRHPKRRRRCRRVRGDHAGPRLRRCRYRYL
ncbi:DNA polymerase III subunit beta [Candidatus Azambacteria bacterium]|nr:DNA polymerase III subunit beta [Candidatus Azambacteria bacterium]